MKVIKPKIGGYANVIASSVPELDFENYVAGTNYALNTKVIYNHKIYQSIQTPNTWNPPDTTPLFWFEVSATNAWQMFNTDTSAQTVSIDPIVVSFKSGGCNSVALFGLEGDFVTVTVLDTVGGAVVYSVTKSLDGTVIGDWSQYFFEERVQLAEVILTDLPIYKNSQITITIEGALGVKCGVVFAGMAYDIGGTEYGVSASIIDYSRKDTTATGVTTLVQRKYSKRMSARMTLHNDRLNQVQRLLASVRATPCGWIGTDAPGYEPLIVFGFYRDFSIDVAYPTQSYCNLEVEGLT